MDVAVLFEYSGIVRDAFIRAGHNAISCDLLPSESSFGPHVMDDATWHDWWDYDLIIAHPPCTHICVSGNRHYAGTPKRQAAADLIDWVWNLPCDMLCIENPVGQINRYLPHFPKPQYIQPWQFGHDASKKTGLWKRGLPDLVPTDVIIKARYANQTPSGQNKLGPSPERAKERARTYQGIADAMAAQWGVLGGMS